MDRNLTNRKFTLKSDSMSWSFSLFPLKSLNKSITIPWCCYPRRSAPYEDAQSYSTHKPRFTCVRIVRVMIQDHFSVYFVNTIRNIIRQLFGYLEILCEDESSLDTNVEELFTICENMSNLNLKR
ncbi:hypothetical protein RF11_11692 [Thelohanellus kitauei]|uniref:Uncharacterized protein n=1 Tax=Thelohanellus kitauei TaxID=669202 RepID=A0A0C2IUH0_THEKT|nr:hypothetical protein RF11_11692 [Thelohanellus kitauei]